jgi:CheY-like chemotaxis protein
MQQMNSLVKFLALPVAAVTALAMTEDIQRMVDPGFDGIETKLINVKNFLVTAAEVLNKKSIAT